MGRSAESGETDKKVSRGGKNPMLWGKFHTVRLLLAPWGRGVHMCVCVHVRVSNGQLLGHTG